MRELDLPTDSLSVYGNRPGERPDEVDPNRAHSYPVINRTEQWALDRPSQYRQQEEGYLSNEGECAYRVDFIIDLLTCDGVADIRNGYGNVPDTTHIEAPQGKDGHSKGLFGFGKKNKPWTLFGGGDHHKTLPPVEEATLPSTSSTPSLKRTQSGSTSDSRSLSDIGPPCGFGGPNSGRGPPPPVIVTGPIDPKQAKKDAEQAKRDAKRAAEEAVHQRRAEQEQAAKARSRAVIQKRAAIETPGSVLEWNHPPIARAPAPAEGTPNSLSPVDKGKERMHPLPRRGMVLGPTGKSAVGAGPLESFNRSRHPVIPEDAEQAEDDYHQMIQNPRSSKARRRNGDDDHSMSSADRRSDRRLSISTVATVDSDPGPARPRQLRERNSTLFLHRAPSHSSLRSGLSTGGSSTRGFSPGARSSTSLEQGFLTEFASMNGPAGVSPTLNHHTHQSHQHPLPHHQHLHHPSRPPESSPDSPHPNSLPPIQMPISPYTVTLPPISSISSPPYSTSSLPSPGSQDITSHSSRETLHPNKQEYVFSIDEPPGSPMNPMFLVVSTRPTI